VVEGERDQLRGMVDKLQKEVEGLRGVKEEATSYKGKEMQQAQALETATLLGAGRTVQAINILGMVTELCEFQLDSWISLMQLHVLEPMLAALKVLADALGRSGTPSPRPSARSGGSRLIRKSPRRGWRAQYTA